jgi:hypothetical protein
MVVPDTDVLKSSLLVSDVPLSLAGAATYPTALTAALHHLDRQR